MDDADTELSISCMQYRNGLPVQRLQRALVNTPVLVSMLFRPSPAYWGMLDEHCPELVINITTLRQFNRSRTQHTKLPRKYSRRDTTDYQTIP